MVLGVAQRTSLSPEEIEMISSETLVDIVPTFKMDTLQLLEDTKWGPFEPLKRVAVPLWLAVLLKKKRRCRILPPPWLTPDHLEDKLKEETTDESFSQLPLNYIEVARVLLESASDDLLKPDTIRDLIKSLREARQSKIREGFKALNPVHLEMPYVSAMEINELRSTFSLAFERQIGLDPDHEQHETNVEMWQVGQLDNARQLADEDDYFA